MRVSPKEFALFQQQAYSIRMSNYIGTHRRPNRTGRRAASFGIAFLAASSLGSGVASAQPALPTIPGTSPQELNQARENFNNGVLGVRDGAIRDTNNLPDEARVPVQQGIDDTTNFVAPGALQKREDARIAAQQKADAARAAAAAAARARANNPCPPSARACVDLANNRTWLQNNGKITYGPVTMSHGKPGQETPRGNFTVQYKVRDEVSREFNNAPMPFATYFTNRGHAFHQGTTNTQSAGCVRMNRADAEFYFNNLNPGDRVFIW